VPDPISPIEMTAKMVAFDTTSALSNLPLIDFVADYLKAFGVTSEIIPDPTGKKANLTATFGGGGAQGGIILSGHSDVVPVKGQAWNTDPFETIKKDGRLYGRGTADMKSFIAVALALVPEFLAKPLRTQVRLAVSYDEEVGCLGAPSLAKSMATGSDAAPTIVIVGEPTSMRVVTAHKGIRSFRTTVTGTEAHSSAPDSGNNAIMHAEKLVSFLRGLAQELRGSIQDPEFDTPFASINVGRIDGGTAVNIIPKTCTIHWEYRPLPGTDENEIIERFHAFTRDEWLPAIEAENEIIKIKTEAVAHVPAYEAEANSPATSLALDLAATNLTAKVSYGSEAGIFQGAGFSTVLCGPGDIADAHIPNESIAISQIDACTDFMRRLITRAQAS
jgi:acetylornithine deacetylase